MSTMHSLLVAKPLYVQVRDVILARIASGEWAPGQALPNEFALAEELHTSIGTVRKAMGLLEEQSVVVRRQGRGTFVRDFSQQPFALSSLVDQSGNALIEKIVSTAPVKALADDSVADSLEIPVGSEVLTLTRVRRHGPRPYMIERSWLPAKLFPVGWGDVETIELPILAQRNMIIVGHGEEKVRPTLASADQAEALEVQEGSAILELERVIFSERGVRLEWRLGHCALRDEQFVVRYK